MLAGCGSPCSHTGGPFQSGTASAAAQADSTASRSTCPATAARFFSKLAARWASGTPRYGLAGASGGAATCSAPKKPPSSVATRPGSKGGSSAAGVPGRNAVMLHGHGYPSPGTPVRSGTGTGNGSLGARTGSQCCSLTTMVAPRVRRGSRATSSSPSRNSVLSHPLASGVTGSPARSGHCAASSRRTRSGVISSSAAGMGLATNRPYPMLSAHQVQQNECGPTWPRPVTRPGGDSPPGASLSHWGAFA